jgi:hypothetical protein
MKCQFEGCTVKRAIFGFEDKKGEFCSKHKKDGMIDLKHSKINCCQKEGCIVKNATFGYPDNKAEFCSKHKKDGMINLDKKNCIEGNKEENIKHNGCKEEECTVKNATFGYPDKDKEYCSKHKKEGMVNLSPNKNSCNEDGCDVKNPTFGYPDKEKEYCSKHKKEGMIELRNRKGCKESGCDVKNATFGFPDKEKEYCSKHKKEGMVNLEKRTGCKENDCNVERAGFGYPNKEKEYCSKHKKEGMINLETKPKCLCGKSSPCFGLKDDESATCCSKCKSLEMIDIVNQKCLCGISPSFGYISDNKPVCCFKCKLPDMILLRKRCKLEFCDTQISNSQYEGYCARCFSYLFPDRPISRNFKTKEGLVVKFIKELYPNYTWIFDKVIENGCSLKRPDIFLDLGYQILVIEVDENQHREYEDICENKRMMILSQDVNHRPIIFIRFNPDKYINKENKNVPSCFSITKATGALKVNNNKNWTYRLKLLKEKIDYWIDKETNKTLELVQLFYDEQI